MPNYEMLYCIVNHGQGSKVLRLAKKHGIAGGTICLCKGTVKSKLLDILDIHDIRKEMVMMIAEQSVVGWTAKQLSGELVFKKHGHGIAFIMPLNNFLGTKHYDFEKIIETKEGNNAMINAIFTIVGKGLAEDTIEAANAAGARGGTIIGARGSGIHDTKVLFAMPVEPEKEVVLILAKNEITEQITDAIREKLHIDEEGNGVIFIMSVNKTYGLY